MVIMWLLTVGGRDIVRDVVTCIVTGGGGTQQRRWRLRLGLFCVEDWLLSVRRCQPAFCSFFRCLRRGCVLVRDIINVFVEYDAFFLGDSISAYGATMDDSTSGPALAASTSAGDAGGRQLLFVPQIT